MSNAELLQNLFSVDASKIEGHAPVVPVYPETIKGRVLHIDGDFLAYQVAADDSKSLDTMMYNHDVAVETLRLLAGAERVVSHLTAAHGDKGNRFNIAIQKEYQACRKGKAKPKHLYTIKSWMQKKRGAINHVIQEADDGLCQANWAAVKAGTPELAVLVSKDKDLQMCQGMHLDWDEGDLTLVSGFGHIHLDRSKSSPKIVGKGNAYFWAQMLTGDAADNIAGLPELLGKTLNYYNPTKTIAEAQATLRSPKATQKQKEHALATLAKRKAGKCGPVIAYDILKSVKTNKDAFNLVKSLYQDYGDSIGFKHWESGEPVDWQKVFVSEAKLLWMRREPIEHDVLNYFKECQ